MGTLAKILPKSLCNENLIISIEFSLQKHKYRLQLLSINKRDFG